MRMNEFQKLIIAATQPQVPHLRNIGPGFSSKVEEFIGAQLESLAKLAFVAGCADLDTIAAEQVARVAGGNEPEGNG